MPALLFAIAAVISKITPPLARPRHLLFEDASGAPARERVAEIVALCEAPDDLTDEALAELEAELLELFQSVRDGEIEGVEALDVEFLQSIGVIVTNLRALAATRIEAANTAAQTIADLEAALAANDPDDDPDDDDDDPEVPPEGAAVVPAEGAPVPVEAAAVVEPEPEPVTAAGIPTRPAPSPLGALGQGRPTARNRPAPAPLGGVAITVGRERVDSIDAVSAAMADAHNDSVPGSGRIPVARFTRTVAPERQLSPNDRDGNLAKFVAYVGDAYDPDRWTPGMIASGGWCAPPEVNYEQVVYAGAHRPVRDSLPSFQASRGSVLLSESPTLASIVNDETAGSAIGVRTSADDEAEVVKSIQTISCAEFAEFDVAGVHRRLRFGDFGAKAFPENVASWNTLVVAAHARRAESRLLDLIKGDAATKKLTQGKVFDVFKDLLETIIRARTAVLNSERMLPGSARVRVMLPEWIVDAAQVGLLRTWRDQPEDALIARQEIITRLNAAGATVTFYSDSPSTGPTQILPKQTDGTPLSAWPTQVQWGMWLEGYFGFMDNGVLRLDVVRDVSTIETNDFENFAETFEGILAHRGPEALWVTQDFCPDGTYAAAIDSPECGS